MGDLNADLKSGQGRKLMELCLDHNLHYLINVPTRITDASQTNVPNYVEQTSVSEPISTNDHCTISATLTFKLNKH